MNIVNPSKTRILILQRKTFTGNGSTTAFNLGLAPASNGEFIFQGGIYQKAGTGNDYTLSGATITFASPPASGIVIDTRCFRAMPGLGLARKGFVGDGATSAFVLDFVPLTNGEFVFKGGAFQKRGTGNDYTISGATITFAVAPVSSANIEARYLKATPGLLLERESFVGDGTTLAFNTVGTSIEHGEWIFKGGLIQRSGGTSTDYIISGSTITFGSAPVTGANIEALYFW